MTAYYNEIEPYAAEWLRNLIKAGMIPHGEVDTRSIIDVAPDDLRGFTQCHFFAGIGGWGYALRLAEWPDDRPIWTGSCPCQPFSVAGKGAGTDDPRHLWPHFHRLISAVRPPVVMGEQVAGAAGYGWLDGVRADLEREDYASRGVDLPALAVNAPHIRQRLYWVALNVADANGYGSSDDKQHSHGRSSKTVAECRGGISSDHMADADQSGRGRRPRDGDGERDRQAGERVEDHRQPAGGGEDRLDVADANVGQSSEGRGDACEMCGVPIAECKSKDCPALFGGGGSKYGSFWSDSLWLAGSDGKSRRSKPGLPLLAHGVSNRVGRLRAYGNAIVPPLAAEVIKAFMETES